MDPRAQVGSARPRLLRLALGIAWSGLAALALFFLFRTPFPARGAGWLAWAWLGSLLLSLALACRILPDSSADRPHPRARSGFPAPGLLLALVLLLALGLRLAWVQVFVPAPVSDFLEYDRIARSFLAGQFQDHYTRPLGYPALLALVYAIRPTAAAGRIFNALLGTLSVFFIFLLARKAGGFKAGLLTALLLALQPTEVFLTSVLCSEIGAAAFFSGAAWLLLESRSAAKPAWLAGAAGLLFSFALLFRTALAVHLPWMLIFLAWAAARAPVHLPINSSAQPSARIPASGRASRWLALAAFLVGVLLPQAVLLGWHSAALGRFTWAPLQNYVADFMLLSGTNVAAAGMFNEQDMYIYWNWPPEVRTWRVVETAWQRISERPLAFARLAAIKIARLLAGSRYGADWGLSALENPRWPPTLVLSLQQSAAWLEQAMYTLLLILAGAYLLRPARPSAIFFCLLLAAVVFTAVPHILLEAQERYRHALLPLLCAAAALGLAEEKQDAKRNRMYRMKEDRQDIF